MLGPDQAFSGFIRLGARLFSKADNNGSREIVRFLDHIGAILEINAAIGNKLYPWHRFISVSSIGLHKKITGIGASTTEYNSIASPISG